MIAAWLRTYFRFSEISALMLRAQLGLYVLLDAFPEDRAAIAHELAVRAWAEALTARLDAPACRWTERGGKS